MVICLASFVVWAGFGAILPYLPVFLKEEAHASMRYIGIIAAAYYVGTFVFSGLLGGLSDCIGRKPVAVVTAAVLMILLHEPAKHHLLGEPPSARPPYRNLITRPVLAFMLVSGTMHFAFGSWEVI